MKKLFLLLLLTIIVSQLLGQMSFTPPPPPMPMHDNFFPSAYNNIQEYRCKIYLKDGTMVEGESGIYKKNDGEFYLKIKKEKYTPSETDSIFVNQCTGIPKFDYWMFETISGDLFVYNKYPVNELNKNSFITKTKNEFIPFNKDNLLIEIEDRPEALTLYNKIRKRKTTSNILSWGGVGVIIVSFLTLPAGGTDEEISDLPQIKFMIGGGIMAFAGMIVRISSDETYFDVVEKYNE